MVEQSLDPGTMLHTTIADEPLFAATEPGALNRVCINLLFNAKEAIDERRRERPADPDYRPRIDVALRLVDGDGESAGDGIELAVSDNGAGMTNEVRARVFEPFFSTKRTDQGSGLGLSTVYGIVSRLGGAVSVTSAPGEGATFTVRLPLASAIPVGESQAPAVAPAAVAAHLLLVDDEQDLLSLADSVLLEAGYECTIASSGELALQAVRARPFDLILLDVNLGELDGWAVLDQVLRERPDQRVLMWSGVAQHVDARQRGALGMLAKPFESEQLLESVAHALGHPLPDRGDSGSSGTSASTPVSAAAPASGGDAPE